MPAPGRKSAFVRDYLARVPDASNDVIISAARVAGLEISQSLATYARTRDGGPPQRGRAAASNEPDRDCGAFRALVLRRGSVWAREQLAAVELWAEAAGAQ